ncbi:hypothetical protein EVG20_g6003 [Dentipellis fragilis]|uniref:Uncharacterized protein n=1 Tax=Dentipellis fragilis TaxID=205917 RepID=A0A4Y9YRC7_9AGAM|nr:hypothetical protein EVG20_g6003 [Dentipellis fragilis]
MWASVATARGSTITAARQCKNAHKRTLRFTSQHATAPASSDNNAAFPTLNACLSPPGEHPGNVESAHARNIVIGSAKKKLRCLWHRPPARRGAKFPTTSTNPLRASPHSLLRYAAAALVNEADVYLEQRKRDEIEHNTLVAVSCTSSTNEVTHRALARTAISGSHFFAKTTMSAAEQLRVPVHWCMHGLPTPAAAQWSEQHISVTPPTSPTSKVLHSGYNDSSHLRTELLATQPSVLHSILSEDENALRAPSAVQRLELPAPRCASTSRPCCPDAESRDTGAVCP